MTDDQNHYENSMLDLRVKITEIGGDIKLVLMQISNSEEKHREHTRRIDKNEYDISELRTATAAANAQAITPKKMWAAIGVLTAIAAVLVAVATMLVKS